MRIEHVHQHDLPCGKAFLIPELDGIGDDLVLRVIGDLRFIYAFFSVCGTVAAALENIVFMLRIGRSTLLVGDIRPVGILSRQGII